ncbi:tRNA glutamyl-Q(34) synthetase GluQRS [Gilvimarinus sp. 1_MG-2023]|uniref:tRNA glutamyl-Q(34) synthetase GluQRS n=1 Tax=Gilvimarinus sp. 1_MG-2023 TaxID=3062638 RepID=UPI0026E19FAB|nr:tRNA glutamyl-Q(34) synthetase GluQRS [Gilvimarinus sp. 1_MG-2023]MDO6746986.1 tRNA glutamyl-Q(34) synthetase GluQRS [Gilvimarinus sp. 1_MG-2023]
MPEQPTAYIGRFAPSPSGPLHFGSLIAALASFLDARQANGHWLVRIDDIDPPREMSGAGDLILHTLEQHGLQWDGTALWQSQRHQAYQHLLHTLTKQGLIYSCTCTRQAVKAMGGVYNGHCRQQTPASAEPKAALRLKLYDLPPPLQQLPNELVFVDQIQGHQRQDLAREVGDAIVQRKDGLFGYQLAVVADDLYQGITHVVRGADLLPVTARQIRFFQMLQQPAPHYAHVPVAALDGRKLSKQNQAPALDNSLAADNIWQALRFLRQAPPLELRGETVETLLQWGCQHWAPEQLEGTGHTLSIAEP